jgi:PAS domain S-box-containing protein
LAPVASDSFGPPFKALHNALIDALPVAVYICDRDARITGFNRRAVELWGREPAPDERFCGSLRMIRPDGSTLPHEECPMADVLRTGEPVRNAGVIVERPDGSRVSVNVAIVPLTDASGQVTGALNTFQDVGELKRADEAVYRRERELHDFVENATEGLHWAGPDGDILWANKADYSLLGYSRDEYVGHHLAEFHADQAVLDDMLARLSRNEVLQEREVRLRCKDGSIRDVVVNSNALWRNGQFVHSQCFTRDVTERKRVEQERTQAEAALRESEVQLRRASHLLQEAVHAREEFLSTAGHELRNPVNALQLQLVALLRATQEGAETVPREWASERIGQAVDAVRRLVRLVETLLDVSRITAGRLDLEPEPMDFGQAVHAVVSRFKDQLQERQLTTRVARTTGSWDRLRVEQIVTNLLSNAIKYGDGLPIEITLEGDDGTVCLSVTDHGIGIEPENQSRLFERFERAVTRRQYGGFGLGLWITQQIVSAMEGHIAVESRPGEGSTFRVTLPRQPTRLTEHAKEASTS